tara:strand:- start:14014 stop:14286 length:273 start_codon:yes stop_codon:yes gene_type:complete
MRREIRTFYVRNVIAAEVMKEITEEFPSFLKQAASEKVTHNINVKALANINFQKVYGKGVIEYMRERFYKKPIEVKTKRRSLNISQSCDS